MPKSVSITFQGKKYLSIHTLVDAWNAENKPIFPATYQRAYEILLSWRKNNSNCELTDEAIEKALTPYTARHAIQYKGKWYKGATHLYRALEYTTEASINIFRSNLNAWKKENPNRKPTDDDINSFLKRTRVQTDDGRFIASLRLMWEELPEPKIQWDYVRKKIPVFRKDFGRELTEQELKEMSTPEEWMDRLDDPNLLGSNDRVLSIREIYDKIEGKKCSYSAFHTRIRKYKLRSKQKPTFEKLKILAKSWGAVDRAHGVLYRWTHKQSGKVYIGITTEALKERTRGHMRQAKNGPWPKGGLHEAIAHDGRKAFKVEKLGKYDDIEELMIAEMIEIEEHGCISPNGFNLAEGGAGVTLRKLPIKFRGKKYKNIAALAKDSGYSPELITSRLYKGWSVSRAIDTLIVQRKPTKIEVNGKSFESIAAMARHFGFTKSTIYHRLRRGWTPEEAVKKAPKVVKSTAQKISIAGATFSSLTKAAKHYGIPTNRFCDRLRHGWTPEEAAGLVKKADRGWTPEEAVKKAPKVVKSTAPKISIEGATFSSLTKAAKHYGIRTEKFCYRLRHGWTPEEAAGLVKKADKRRKPITISGNKFPSTNDAARF